MSESTNTDNTIPSEIIFGYRHIPIVEATRLDVYRPVYHVYHNSFTLDGLHKTVNRQPILQKFLNLLQSWLPAWFLPREFVVKVYEPSTDVKEMRAETRFCNEETAYRRLRSVQGFTVPKCYGKILWNHHPALILQYIKGQTLEDFARPFEARTREIQQAIKNCKSSRKSAPDSPGRQKLEALQRSLKEQFTTSTKSSSIQSLVQSLKDAASILTTCGVKGDFNGGNILCHGKDVVILDFDIHEEDSPENVKLENLVGLSSLLRTKGLEDGPPVTKLKAI